MDILLNIETIYGSNKKPLYSISTQQDVSEIVMIRNNLGEKLEELETFQKLTVRRELKMVELKNKIAQLEQKLLAFATKLRFTWKFSLPPIISLHYN